MEFLAIQIESSILFQGLCKKNVLLLSRILYIKFLQGNQVKFACSWFNASNNFGINCLHAKTILDIPFFRKLDSKRNFIKRYNVWHLYTTKMLINSYEFSLMVFTYNGIKLYRFWLYFSSTISKENVVLQIFLTSFKLNEKCFEVYVIS